MNPDERWERAKSLLDEALQRTPADRDAFLVEACGGDGGLLDEVRALLRHHASDPAFLLPPEPAGPPAEDAPTDLEGVELGDRYRLVRHLGDGGFSVVYEAEDRLARRRVAVKIFRGELPARSPELRREIATLRWLRLPGVVRLLDEGRYRGKPYLVMNRVEGRPFPGCDTPAAWPAIQECTRALLEILARLHWAGIYHCDLKPTNVLVDKAGVPVVLDLGISAGPALRGDLELSEGFAGTPRYAAPERFRGEEPSARTDLYSVGVMLYEALCDPAVREGEGPLGVPPERAPLGEAAPGVPKHVTDLIDRLVAPDSERRPATALDALLALDGPEGAYDRTFELPRLGGDAPVERLVEAGHAGRAATVGGPDGSGRSRCLREAIARLEADGFEVLRAGAGTEPLSAVLAALGHPDGFTDRSLDQARARLGELLRARLRHGAILAVDDADALDRWSAAVIEDCEKDGCVIRVVGPGRPAEIVLEPLPAAALRDLIAGLDRIHHIREDAAHELHRRTGGLPAAVDREVSAWVRAGLARRDGGRLHVSRAALEQLRLGLRIAPPATGATRVHALDPAEEDLVVCLEMAGPRAGATALAGITGQPRWRVEARLEDLERRGLIQRRGDNGYDVFVGTHQGLDWPPERLFALHARVADLFEPGSFERLRHLLAARRLDDVVREVPEMTQRLIDEGRGAAAESTVLEGLRVMQEAGDHSRDEELISLLLSCALASGTSPALDLVLHHAARSPQRSARLEEVERVAKGAQLALQGDGARALALLDEGGCLVDEREERERQSVRVIAASSCPLDVHERVVDEVRAWAAARGSRAIRAAEYEWLGWLRYRQGRFAEAARLHGDSAAHATCDVLRASALIDAAWAALEAFDLDGLRVLATRARRIAAEARHAHYEARAEVVLRCGAYRAGEAGEPDLELIEATGRLGVGHTHGLAQLNEAAVAWRAGNPVLAQRLAAAAVRRFDASGEPAGAILARGLALLCGDADQAGLAADLERRARACPLPGVSLQGLGMVAQACGELEKESIHAAREAAERLPASVAERRREVLSAAEAMAAVEAVAG